MIKNNCILSLIIVGLFQGLRAEENCPNTGVSFLPYYMNCKLFFECREGAKSIMRCPDYYAFDKTKLMCVDEDEVDCGYVTTTTKPAFCPEIGVKYYPHLADCTFYFQCLNGALSLEKCPESFAWSIKEEACILIETADCSYTTGAPMSTTPAYDCPSTGTSFIPNYGDCQAYYKCEDGKRTAMVCPKDRKWNPEKNYCDFPENVICNDEICPATGNTVLPDLVNCTHYYECKDGTKTRKECPTGQAFNIKINNCDDVEIVDCSYTTTGAPTTLSPTTPSMHECPPSGTDYLPHEYNCSNYYECENGEKILRRCIKGMSWDINKKSCEDELTVDCGYTSTTATTTPLTTTTTTQPTTIITTETTTTTETTATTETTPTTEGTTGTTPDPYCPDKTIISYHAHPYNCSQFYECHYGERILMECPVGYLWDNIATDCDVESVVDCSYTSISPTWTSDVTASMTDNLCYNYYSGVLLKHPTSCKKYIRCWEGQDIVEICEESTSWNPYKMICDTDSKNCQNV